ncbi:hypothetical protein ABE484_22805 [Pseudomonas pudica]|uniref:Uncharacterized protein n=1 Tax=Pseudomonas plecoglossicida TaxID=70775 RepID=A0A2R7UQX5_PSEDL|nr:MULTISPECIES: hypothetical protein [Pseudomonas]PTU53912.1 hypothetical protein DBB42_02280 [Pseudomonas plecoglossicida]
MEKKDGKGRRQKHGEVTIPREEWVYGHATEKVSSLTLQKDSVTGKINIFEIDPSTIRRQITHKREAKDDKVLYSAPADDFSLSLTNFEEMRQRFDYLMAVDTNTLDMVYKGYKVSACCIYVVKDHLESIVTDLPFQHHATFLILNPNHEEKNEPIGWHLAISQSIAPWFLQSCRIGMIVDSELGKHIDINAGVEPYYGSYHLPQKLRFIYASDRSATYANSMIKQCHSSAKMVLEHFEGVGIDSVLQRNPLKLGDALCYKIVSSQQP